MRKTFRFLSILFLFSFITPLYASLFTLESGAFNDWEKLDPVFTCNGKNISPPLQWSHPPQKTVSYALIMSDPDAPGGTFYHWVLFNIPASVTNLPQNISALPAGTKGGKNSWDKLQYNGPCPPHGAKHTYIFSLYALDTMLDMQQGDAQAVLSAMQNHVLGEAELKAMFER